MPTLGRLYLQLLRRGFIGVGHFAIVNNEAVGLAEGPGQPSLSIRV